MYTIDSVDPSVESMGSVVPSVGADCDVLYFHGPDPVGRTKLAMFNVLHVALARASSWIYLSDGAENEEQHRVLSAIRNSRVDYEPQHEIGAEAFGQRKNNLDSRLKDQFEIRRYISRQYDPAENVAWFVKKMGVVVAANRDVAKLQRRLQVAGELFLTAQEKEGKGEREGEHSETMTKIDEVLHAHLTKTLLATRNAVLVRFMGLNSLVLMAVARRVAIEGVTRPAEATPTVRGAGACG